MTTPQDDDARRPLIKRLPPPNVASPSQLRPRDPADVRWYKPTWPETARLMGWRWLYFFPAAALILFACIMPALAFSLTIFFWKMLFFAIAVPIGVFIKTASHGLRMNKEPFCIHCGYNLTALPDHHNCPECGEPYEFSVIEEYRRDPDWFIKRYQVRKNIPAADLPFEAGKIVRRKSKDGT